MKLNDTVLNEAQPAEEANTPKAPKFGRNFFDRDVAEVSTPAEGAAPEAATAEPLADGEDAELEQFAVAAPRKPVNQATIALFGFMVLACGLLYWFFMHTPASAKQAAQARQQQEQATRATVSQFLTAGQSEISAMRGMLSGAPRLVAQFRDYTNVPQVPLEDLHTNPFQFSTLHPEAAVDLTAAAEKTRREQERQSAFTTVKSLQLQSILLGAHRACMINGKMLQEGQQTGVFTIEKINPGSVVVRTGVYRFELKMSR